MPSPCNNNTNITRIYVSQPCDPCNACTSCNRCACECACDLPDYSTAGCISLQGSDCVKYTGPDIPDQNIETNDLLTKVIQNLAASINGTPLLAPMPMAPAVSTEEFESKLRDFQYQTSGVVNQIELVKSKIDEHGLSNDLKVRGDGIISGSVKKKALKLKFNFDGFMQAFMEYVQADPANAAKFAQILTQIASKSGEFLTYPQQIGVGSSASNVVVRWANVENAVNFSVFFKEAGEKEFKKAGDTPALGMTIPGLKANTEYEIYVVTNGQNGLQSEPSPVITAKTN